MDSTTTFDGYHRFLRFGNILGAALREILEVRFLEDECAHSLSRAQFYSLKLIALEAQKRWGLKDGGKDFKLGGMSIPEQWNPEYKGSKYRQYS